MSLHANYPDPQALWKNELKTLEFLSTNLVVSKYFNELSYNALLHANYLKENVNSHISFEAKLNLTVENKKRSVYVGAVVTSKLGEDKSDVHDWISYYLAVSDNAVVPRRLLRKYHFDFVGGATHNNHSHPAFHLQYGGKLSQYLLAEGLTEKHLNPWLSNPRITFYPVTLALVLDVVFCEFPSLETRKIAENHLWRDLIKANEVFIIKPFYEEMMTFITSGAHNRDHLVRDYCYGR